MEDYRGDNTTGFQSPAQDYVEPVIDLAARLDLGRPHIYPVRVVGQALSSRGIHDGDVLVANAAADPKGGEVCIAIMNGDVVLATLRMKEGVWWLHPSSLPSKPVGDDVEVWAVVEALVRFKV